MKLGASTLACDRGTETRSGKVLCLDEAVVGAWSSVQVFCILRLFFMLKSTHSSPAPPQLSSLVPLSTLCPSVLTHSECKLLQSIPRSSFILAGPSVSDLERVRLTASRVSGMSFLILPALKSVSDFP